MYSVEYLKVTGTTDEGKAIHSRVTVIEGISQLDAEDCCRDAATMIKGRAFVVKDSRRIYMVDRSQKELI